MDRQAVCDYEGSDYRTRFWARKGRDYEDQVERIALKRLMPSSGDTLIDIGAGFGRLAGEYSGYRRVVLFDYSRSLLREAQRRLGDDPRFIYVAGNWYKMPFVPGLFQTLIQVRTIHHAPDVPSLFHELARISRPNGHYVLEFANKHNFKAILRYWTGRQRWSPFSPEPVEFAELNFDFHPRWMSSRLSAAGFCPEHRLSVSYFRIPLVKKIVPTQLLAGLDGLAQFTGRWWQLSPSVFIASWTPADAVAAPPDAFFACPACLTGLGPVVDGQLICPNSSCGQRWAVTDGLFDFKEPVGLE